VAGAPINHSAHSASGTFKLVRSGIAKGYNTQNARGFLAFGVHAGQQILPPALAERLAARQRRSDLTPRELTVLGMLVKGRSNKEISQALFIAEDTVKAQLKSIFFKLGVHDRTDASRSAIRLGIVHFELLSVSR
jgi:DNA-binding CsgD family transcriptional regulator